MIENLKETLPSYRQEELKRQLSLLDREAKRLFHYPEEVALAAIADSQGLGGHSSKVTRELIHNRAAPASSDVGRRTLGRCPLQPDIRYRPVHFSVR
jgi:hypothetical protein